MQVLLLLEALVNFVSCNDGSFLHTIVSGDSMERGLRDRGAPESLIATFMVCSTSPHAWLNTRNFHTPHGTRCACVHANPSFAKYAAVPLPF